MSYLLDTNVISELRKPVRRADHGVRVWASRHAQLDLYLSVITIMEVEIGIGRISRRDAVQGRRLHVWFEEELLDVFDGRILSVDNRVARKAAHLHVPDPRPDRDALIAATASVHGLTVVTRNVKDFENLDVPLINPWSS